ncbi:MAG: cohesin domain-containing protein [Nitrososphaerota archaeon]
MKKLLSLFIALMLLEAALSIMSASSQEQPTIYVDPPSIVNTSMVPDTTFKVNVSLRNVLYEHDLVGVEFKLFWDPAVLEGVRMDFPPGHMFQAAQDDNNLWVIKKTVDKTAGVAWYMVTCSSLQQGYDNGYLPLVGSGVLATITFKVKAFGRTCLELGVHKLSDGQANPIHHNVEHGYFRNTPVVTATIMVEPKSIVDVSMVPNKTFSVNISVVNVVDLRTFEFKLSFNPSILNALSVSLGEMFPATSSTIPPPWINNTEGWIKFGATLPEGEPPKSGNGTLAVVLFNVTGLSATPLMLSEILLIDNYGEAIPYISFDGYFNNVLLAKMYVNPPEIIDPSLVPPKTFMVDINLYNIENMYGYEFNLTFNKNVLICLSIVIHDVLNETNYITDSIISNTQGFVWIKVDYYPPATPITSYKNITLVTITFRVKSMGVSLLDLHDTRLMDPEGRAISHEVGDGLFISLIRDVAVVDVKPEMNYAYQGWIIQINVTVTNKGNLTETFDVKVYYDATIIGTLTVKDLMPNRNFTVTFYWDTKDVPPCRNYTISAEVTTVPYELKTDDNFLKNGWVKVKLMGDIDGNGVVDLFDAVLLSDAAGTYEGHARWNPEADLDRNKYIDIFDAVILSVNSGKFCT